LVGVETLDKVNLENRFAELYGRMLDNSDRKTRDYLWATYDHRMKAHDNIRCLLKMKRESKETEVGDSLIYASCFVLAFEGSYVRTIDSIVFLLILAGHDLLDPLTAKYAHSPDEIGKIHISVKFKFLKEHKFETLVREEDSQIRNKIAHHDFEICGGNEISIRSKKYCMKTRLEDLLGFVRDITQPFVAALKKESDLRGIKPTKG
jgi:hypothetical protein